MNVMLNTKRMDIFRVLLNVEDKLCCKMLKLSCTMTVV
jgi:hypothetical protein